MSATEHTTAQNLSKQKKYMLVVILLVGTFCTVLNQTLLATAYPTLMHYFHLSANTIQWLTTGFLLVNGIMIPVTAWLMNTVPSKWLYVSAMFIFLVGTIFCATAKSFEGLLLGRIIQAVGVGISIPLLQTIMLNIFPPNERGRAMGLVGLVIGLGPAIGPTLSGWVVDHHPWRVLFWLVIPIVTVVLIAALFLMPSVLPLTHPPLDALSLLWSTLGFGSLLYGFSSVGQYGWNSVIVLGTLVLGILFIAIFIRRQLRLEHPFLEMRVFKSRPFAIAALLSGVTNMAMVGIAMVFPLYVQELRGQSAFHSGLMLLPGAILMGIMMPISGNIFDKYGAKYLARIGMGILTLATVPFLFINETTPFILLIIFYGLRMFGISLVMMPVTTSGMNSLPTSLISHGTAVNNTFRQIASSIGTAILVSVLSNTTKKGMPSPSLEHTDPSAYHEKFITATLNGYHAAFVVALIFCIIGWIVAFQVGKDKRHHHVKSA